MQYSFEIYTVQMYVYRRSCRFLWLNWYCTSSRALADDPPLYKCVQYGEVRRWMPRIHVAIHSLCSAPIVIPSTTLTRPNCMHKTRPPLNETSPSYFSALCFFLSLSLFFFISSSSSVGHAVCTLMILLNCIQQETISLSRCLSINVLFTQTYAVHED